MLETKLKELKAQRPILLMTHLVLGYPSFEENLKAIEAMSEAGVELIELQIPFSEPSADGPVIVRANAASLERGTKVDRCFEFAAQVCAKFPQVNFLFMTYYNLVCARGEERFLAESKAAGIQGFILPDLPPEESEAWRAACKEAGLDNVLIMTPTSSPARLAKIGQESSGLVYSVGRKGVTGLKTDFGQEIEDQIARYRAATDLPLALGFGVKSKTDVDFLIGKVDIAVIGSKLIELHETEGAQALGPFLKSIR